MNARLRIELLSDCLPGSGMGNSALIDTDCVFDAYGFPMIPGKRLKGCLRETAQKLLMMGYPEAYGRQVEALFGDAQSEGSLLIGNAEIEGVQALKQQIDHYRSGKAGEATFLLMPDAVREYYTCLHTRTAIGENGVAKDHSLRTVRTVRRGNVFECDLSFPAEDETLVRTCAKALRHIGTNRSRGFGHVRMELMDAEGRSGQGNEQPAGSSIDVVLRLKTPVIVDTPYIPGVMARGAIAAQYMKRHSAPPSGDYSEDPLFCSLFLEDCFFGPAVLTDREHRAYHPVSASVVRLKVPEKERCEYYDLAVSDPPGTQTKSVKPNVVWSLCSEEKKAYVQKVRHVKHMHHAMTGEMFSYEALEAGQLFRMRISGKPEALRDMQALLGGIGELRIGKSRGAQYGCVAIEDIKPSQEEAQCAPSRRFVMTLEAPAILTDDHGTPRADCSVLLRALEEKLGCGVRLIRAFAVNGSVEGYNAQWRLSKPSVPALDVSTTVVFETEEEMALPREMRLGERNQEGYGLVRIDAAAERKPEFDGVKPITEVERVEASQAWKAFLSQFENRYVHQKLRQHAIDRAQKTVNDAVKEAVKGAVRGRAREELASRAVQSLYTLALQAESFEGMLATVGGIRDRNKQNLCRNLLNVIGNQYENQAVKAVREEPVCPPIRGIGLNNQWAWKQFYMVEMLGYVIRLQAKGRQENHRAGGAG